MTIVSMTIIFVTSTGLISLLSTVGGGTERGWNIRVRMTERASGATRTTQKTAEMQESISERIVGDGEVCESKSCKRGIARWDTGCT